MQINIVVRSAADGWHMELLDPTTGAPMRDQQQARLLDAPRQLRRIEDPASGVAYPLPPLDEASALPLGAPHRDLCLGAAVEQLRDTYTRILAHDPGDDGMEKFGRYLFATLLGDRLWGTLRALADAANDTLELALCWAAGEPNLHRLPWEAMHGPDLFLAQEPKLAITRRILGAPAPAQIAIETPPRVLFVVGADWNNRLIEHGGEYLGFLWSLRYAHLELQHQVLHQPTTALLQSTIAEFQPAVVHFICPTTLVDGAWALSLGTKNASADVTADRLLECLGRGQNQLPPIVVLTACPDLNPNIAKLHKAGQLATPLAVELIQGGVPIVAGMSGQIVDQACRLYSWCFYEALMHEGTIDLAAEAAIGRRAGLPHEHDERAAPPIVHSGKLPWTKVDWAMPTIWMADGVIELRVTLSPREAECSWHRIASDKFIYPSLDYPIFCGRMELFEQYDLLMAEPEFQRRARENGELQVLAVFVEEDADDQNHDPEPDESDAIRRKQYGRTRLLKEFALEAVRDGHIPLLMIKQTIEDGDQPWPIRPRQLLDALVKIAYQTSKHFTPAGATFPYLRELSSMIRRVENGEAAPALPEALRQEEELNNAYNNQPGDPALLAIAFRLDIANYVKRLRNRHGDHPPQPTIYDRYSRGIRALLSQLGQGHARFNEALAYQTTIEQTIAGIRQFGETPQRTSDLREVLANLNQLTLDLFNTTFNDLYAQAAAAADTGRPPGQTKLLLLIDDVHRMGDAAQVLLNHMLSRENLDALFDDLRVVLTYSTAESDVSVRTQIANWMSDSARKEPMPPLQKFREPVEERLVYEHFLRYWRDPSWKHQHRLTLVPESPEKLNAFIEALREEIKRVPANLASDGVKGMLRLVTDMDGKKDPTFVVLRPYDDYHAREGVV